MRRLLVILSAALLGAWTLAADLTVDSSASSAQYRVREQLVGVNFPNDAVGVTTTVTGTIALNDDGTVADGSVITIDVSRLASDDRRRDDYLRRSTLETSRYPTVTFSPTAVEGLPSVLPTDGEHEVVITGELTVRDVTITTRWAGTATFDGTTVGLTASTTFTFADAGMSKPRAMLVLSVEDDITLEVNLTLRAEE